ncbi:DUF6036 family nucleotidyltransferase [Dactylosporangium sp. CS-033363]|uniref:DUF6036 family nucleotidyltransferase n=1 Tax=Dactylosporangium sp. CS-033363 TaxID=3239935 RepID=UPI003D902191
MNRRQLEHVLRAVSAIVGDPDVLVIGSQSILGAIPEHLLPPVVTRSTEVDIAFFDDPDGRKADLVDGGIGEMSAFDSTYGYYAQGVDTSTAILPAGWRDRLVLVESANTGGTRARCLEPHDCAASKLAAGREKDLAFVSALLEAGLIDGGVLAARIEAMDIAAVLRDRMLSWVAAGT